MDARELSGICTESCRQMASYLARYNGGSSKNDVLSYKFSGDTVTLYTATRASDQESLSIEIDGTMYDSAEANFTMFDAINKAVVMEPSKRILAALRSPKQPKVRLVSDLKWLITRVRKYYSEFGGMIRPPAVSDTYSESDFVFPKGNPTQEQRQAVDMVLNNGLSYVWGAPGTGKTKFVLATSILTLLSKGKKVLVIASTNNAIENIMRGVLDVLRTEDPDGKIVNRGDGVLRIGIPSEEFALNYGQVCEAKGIASRIQDLRGTRKVLSMALLRRRIRTVKRSLSMMLDLCSGQDKGDVGELLDDVKEALEGTPFFIQACRLMNDDTPDAVMSLMNDLRKFESSPDDLGSFDEWTDDAIQRKRDEIDKKVSELKPDTTESRAEKASLIAMTPLALMGRFCPEGQEVEGFQELRVDHIFVDEAGYCSMIHLIPLFAFGVPVSLLGDHLQLPPVCEIDESTVKDAAVDCLTGFEDENLRDLKYTFLWSQSAIYAENYLYGSFVDVLKEYVSGKEPTFNRMARCDLTASHRFGENLGRILDECVYRNGITGVAENPLEIVCVDVVCHGRKDRSNQDEACAVRDYIKAERLPYGSFVVLAPYNKQMYLLWSMMPDLREEIMNIHRSQGMEWDTVILTVCDNDDEIPSRSRNLLQFTSTVGSAMGPKVINTAVSRAKKRLVLVCD